MPDEIYELYEKNTDNEICLRCGASRTALKEMITQGDRGNLTIVEAITSNCPACKKALGMMK